jgi:hypothetical protein
MRSATTSHPPPLPPAAAQSPKRCPCFFVAVEMATVVVVLVNAIDLEKSFKPSQQLKSYIEYAKTQESECRAHRNNLYR